MPSEKQDFPIRWNRRQFIATLTAAVLSGKVKAGALAAKPREVFLVPNFHPASCGWLTTFFERTRILRQQLPESSGSRP